MGELSQKLHYKTKTGETGEATIYDSLEDCPEPNLKMLVNGVQGYVKLGTAEDGEIIPIKVKTLSSGGLNVLKEGIVCPTGQWSISRGETKSLTIPNGVKVVRVNHMNTGFLNLAQAPACVGVTPNATYTFQYVTHSAPSGKHTRRTKRLLRLATKGHEQKQWSLKSTTSGISYDDYVIEWSPEINKMGVKFNDFI